jgi:hypothetical protein
MTQTTDHEGLEIIANIQQCDKEARQKQLLVPIHPATEWAVMSTGKSQKTILRI